MTNYQSDQELQRPSCLTKRKGEIETCQPTSLISELPSPDCRGKRRPAVEVVDGSAIDTKPRPVCARFTLPLTLWNAYLQSGHCNLTRFSRAVPFGLVEVDLVNSAGIKKSRLDYES